MTHDEALHEAVMGARMRPSHWQPGVYLEHSFSRGFLKCWPVDKPEDEPIRSQCDYRAAPEDAAAIDWAEIERPSLAVDHSPKDAWGRTTKASIMAELVPVVAPVGWGKPLPKPEPAPSVEFCGVCDFEKSKCKCEPKKEPNKWGR